MIWCSQVLLLVVGWSLGAEVPLGVPFSALSAYRIGEEFKCLNHPLTIPWSKVNDDYCDCPDGSDEPGSSACENGVFFCRDVQYKVVSIPSSFVNDEVVDCCDGSDEYDGRTKHESTCSILAEKHEQARLTIQKGVNEGHEIYKEYVKTLKERQIEEQIAAEKAAAERTAKESDALNDSVHDVPPTDKSGNLQENSTSQVTENVEENMLKENVDHMNDAEQNPGGEIDENPVTPATSAPPRLIDYGPGEGFRMLLEPPGYFEFTDKQYTYRFFPFDKIYQRNKGSEWSSTDTLLGRWQDWSYAPTDLLHENKYALMIYDDGQPCWNGPSRSVKVHVHCDSRNEIRSVEEPSRCVYTMHLHTPAACFEPPEVILRRLNFEV